MKKKVLALAAAITLVAPMQTVAFAHENDGAYRVGKLQGWSAEARHKEGVNSHLWIVNRAMDIMSRNTTIVKQEQLALLNEWRTDLENGIYSADYENPYYDNSTFTSHFYDPDSGKTYISFAKQAKETGAKYFKLAGESYQNKDMKQAFFYLGLSLHYLGDVNQPMHAANFTNLSYPQGFHSKYENFVDTIKDNYKVTDGNGYWNWKGRNPEDWIHAAAVVAKQDFPGIVNDNTKDWFVRATISQEYADKWRAEVTPMTGKRLMDAQRVTAGYIQLWFDTYVNR
ncbi:phospholipase CerA [Bacillus cytotoxicus]|uniref:phospholipase CerA n=1 Tax=Bacillus cereus group sp. BfR-BA-01492 TaxID=2920361 RepID=UPI001F56EE87|nr:phospholipase CerA [Bacillus cereus group sp. BfR-BA-01492]EMA6343817.1 zinc dependent phospholipase C family protein [Bacillus cytotoxicus]